MFKVLQQHNKTYGFKLETVLNHDPYIFIVDSSHMVWKATLSSPTQVYVTTHSPSIMKLGDNLKKIGRLRLRTSSFQLVHPRLHVKGTKLDPHYWCSPTSENIYLGCYSHMKGA